MEGLSSPAYYDIFADNPLVIDERIVKANEYFNHQDKKIADAFEGEGNETYENDEDDNYITSGKDKCTPDNQHGSSSRVNYVQSGTDIAYIAGEKDSVNELVSGIAVDELVNGIGKVNAAVTFVDSEINVCNNFLLDHEYGYKTKSIDTIVNNLNTTSMLEELHTVSTLLSVKSVHGLHIGDDNAKLDTGKQVDAESVITSDLNGDEYNLNIEHNYTKVESSCQLINSLDTFQLNVDNNFTNEFDNESTVDTDKGVKRNSTLVNVGKLDINSAEDLDIKPDLQQLAGGNCFAEGTSLNCESETCEVKVIHCKECCMVFDNIGDFDIHLIICDVDAKKTKICDICRVAFPDLKSFNTHDCCRIAEQNDYTCGVCNKTFKKRDVVNTHLKIHKSSKEFVCEICQKPFLHKHHLTHHMKTHGNERPYKCQVCSAAFKRQSNLQKHQNSHKPVTVRKYKCTHCDWSFHEKYKLTRHEQTHSYIPTSVTCDICGSSFREKHILKKHIKFVHSDDTPRSCKKPKKQIECEVCGITFFWRKHLRNHMKIHPDVVHASEEDSNDSNVADDSLKNENSSNEILETDECLTKQLDDNLPGNAKLESRKNTIQKYNTRSKAKAK